MRMIGTVQNEDQAQRFSDYLLVADIDAHIEESARGAWQMWVEHDDDLDRAKAELEAFLARPDDPKYASTKSSASQIRKIEETTAQKRRENYVDYRTTSAWSGMGSYGTPVIIFMIACSFLVCLLTQFGSNQTSIVFQTLLFQSNPTAFNESASDKEKYEVSRQNGMFTDISHGQVWRLISPIFIHFGPVHIIFNMMFFWQLGGVIESQKGMFKTILLILTIALVSCLAEALYAQFTDPWRWESFGGMSGVCGGLFGYAWMKSKYQPYERIIVAEQQVWYVIIWFLACSFGFIGHVANAAHWSGLITGVVIGIAPKLVRMSRR